MIHDITAKVGKYKTRKRCGRGEGSGLGGTSGRGHKGAKSRSGWKRRPAYEGGRVPLIRRIPKRGFTNAPFREAFAIVNLKSLEAAFASGAEVNAAAVAAAGLIRSAKMPLKVLGEGDLTKKLNVTAAKFSGSAKSKIEAVGGTVTVIERRTWTREAAPAKANPAQ
jgi:large subunit ribosomal protein L15